MCNCTGSYRKQLKIFNSSSRFQLNSALPLLFFFSLNKQNPQKNQIFMLSIILHFQYDISRNVFVVFLDFYKCRSPLWINLIIKSWICWGVIERVRYPSESSSPTPSPAQGSSKVTPCAWEDCPNASWIMLSLLLWPFPWRACSSAQSPFGWKNFLTSNLNLPWLSFMMLTCITVLPKKC